MSDRPRVVVVGGGFAGFHAARNLAKRLGDESEIVLVNTTDYFLYLPLLPEVAAGVLEPRRIAVPLAASLPGVRVVLGEVDEIDLADRRVGWSDPEGERDGITYDRLLLAVGSVNKLLPIPGVAEHAHGFRGLPEALYLRDHIVRQFEIAADTDDPAERAARCTFVVVGAGYTGTEVAAQGVLLTDNLRAAHPELRDQPVRWMLLDTAERVLPELDERLSATADRVLRERGVEVRMGVSVDEADHDGVRLTDGRRGADAHAGLVRRGPGGPAGREPRAEDREGPRRRRRVHARARAPGGVRLRRRRGRPGRDPSRAGRRR